MPGCFESFWKFFCVGVVSFSVKARFSLGELLFTRVCGIEDIEGCWLPVESFEIAWPRFNGALGSANVLAADGGRSQLSLTSTNALWAQPKPSVCQGRAECGKSGWLVGDKKPKKLPSSASAL